MNDLVDTVTARATTRRVQLDELWAAFAAAAPVDAAAADARTRLAAALADGQETGVWTCAKKTDRTGHPPLPAFITLPAPPPNSRPDPAAVAWRPELAWATQLPRLSSTQLHMLQAVNAFLRDSSPTRPLVPAEERSLELFGNEKAITNQTGGTTLWQPGRLTHQLLRCVPSTAPFAYEPVGDGPRLLVVENQATFATTRDLLRATPTHPYAAVVFGAGRQAATTIRYLTALPFPVTAVDYFGDLDVDGLEVAAACIAAARTVGVTADLHQPLWRLLLHQPASEATNTPGLQRARQATAVLPDDLRNAAADLLTSGQRIPQERCGTDLLAHTPRWWSPSSPTAHRQTGSTVPATCDRCGGIHDTYRYALERNGVPAGHTDQPWDDSQTCEWDAGMALDAAVERLANDGRHTVGTRIPLGGGVAITDQGDEVGWDDDQPVDGTIILA